MLTRPLGTVRDQVGLRSPSIFDLYVSKCCLELFRRVCLGLVVEQSIVMLLLPLSPFCIGNCAIDRTRRLLWEFSANIVHYICTTVQKVGVTGSLSNHQLAF